MAPLKTSSSSRNATSADPGSTAADKPQSVQGKTDSALPGQARERPRGRPSAADSADVRDALLDAAAQLFSERGYEGTSVRQLATSAGVTPAMVNYYFGNKNGLYQALLERAFDGLLPHIMGITEATSSEELMATIFDVAHGALVPQPWIPQLLLREVLSQDGKLRDVFVERFASRVAQRVSGVLGRQQQEGSLRPDLDPELIYVCLIALVIFPILGRPVLEQILGQSLDEPEVLAKLRHTAQSVFFSGVLSGASRAERGAQRVAGKMNDGSPNSSPDQEEST